MSASAPLIIPVEIAPAAAHDPNDLSRMFRLTSTVAIDRLLLKDGLPDEPEWLRGPLKLAFHLPGDALALSCLARAAEVVVDEGREGERAERRALVFETMPPEAAERVGAYVDERMQLR